MPDPLVTTNLILCIVIFTLGLWEYRRSGLSLSLYVGVAFGLFGVSHLLTLAGLAGNLELFLIAMRFLAYLLVIDALWMLLGRKKK